MFSEKMRIVLVPNNDSGTKNFKIPTLVIKIAVGLLISLLIGIGIIIWQYTEKEIDENRLYQLEQENEILHSKVETFSEKVSTLQDIMKKYVEFDKQIRVLADIDEKNEDLRKLGIGGPVVPDSAIDQLAELNSEKTEQVKSIQVDIEKLIREAQFQESSFKNIISSIKDKQEIWDHTPSVKPLNKGVGVLVSGFGFRRDPFTGRIRRHEGMDFATRRGTPIIATADGEVISTKRRQGYGLTVVIDHGFGYTTRYAHCSLIKVKDGDKVERGQVIALVGNTGRSTGPHVHYEVRVANRPTNPQKYILPEVVTD